MSLRCMEYITYLSPLCSTHLLYDILRLRLLALLFASLRFGNPKMTCVIFVFTFNTRPCNGCDLPANRTDITTMTSFRYDGVHYISERIGLWFCMGTMMTRVTDYVHDKRDIQICS